MASQLIVPVWAPVSSHDMAQFLATDGIGAGFVRHADIWLNIDAFVEMVWALAKTPRKDGTLMKIVYIRHTVIETELFVDQCTKRLRCKAQCGIFPDDEVRVTSMTFGQARELLTPRTAHCENIIILVDGTYLETVDTEIGTVLINQSINPNSCVKIIGLYSDNWDDKKAAEAVPLSSSLFREVGIEKLSVSFNQSSTAGVDLEPMLVDQSGLIDAMVECINNGKHIVFFLPRETLLACVSRITETPAKRKDVLFKAFPIGSETSMATALDENFDLNPMFSMDSYLMIRIDKKVVRVCSVAAAIDAEAGFTTLPIKRVGLVVHSHQLDQNGRSRFNWDAGTYTCSAIQKRVGDEYLRSQRQSCRSIRAKQVCLYSGGPGPDIACGHPVDHSRDFVLHVIRNWPGKPMSQLPLKLAKRDPRRLGQTLDHLAVAGIIEPHENGYLLTRTKGLELVEVLPKAVSCGLSFELAVLVASAKHCVKHERSMRLLIRLAVLGSRATEFLSRLDPGHVNEGNQTTSWLWMQQARQHMAGPARGEMSAGRLWFALGIWDKMRKDTNNFSSYMPRNDDEPDNAEGSFHRLEGIGMFHCGIAVDMYMSVLQLEDRLGLSLLAPSDAAWEEPLKTEELHEVQVQLMFAFISSLAVWNIGADEVLLMGSRRQVVLAPRSLVAHPHAAKVERRPKKGYLIVADCIEEGKGDKLSVISASRIPLSLLRLITIITGEPAGDWLKWP